MVTQATLEWNRLQAERAWVAAATQQADREGGQQIPPDEGRDEEELVSAPGTVLSLKHLLSYGYVFRQHLARGFEGEIVCTDLQGRRVDINRIIQAQARRLLTPQRKTMPVQPRFAGSLSAGAPAPVNMSVLVDDGGVPRITLRGDSAIGEDVNGMQVFRAVVDPATDVYLIQEAAPPPGSQLDRLLLGTRVCAQCGQRKDRSEFSATQLKLHAQGKCKSCVEAASAAAGAALPGGPARSASAVPASYQVPALAALTPKASESSSSVSSSSSVATASVMAPGGLAVPNAEVAADANSDLAEECCLCLSPLWDDPAAHPVAILTCGHQAHNHCLTDAVRAQVESIVKGDAPADNGYGAAGPRGSCPLCRHEVSLGAWGCFSHPFWFLPANWVRRITEALQSLPTPGPRSATRRLGIPFDTVFRLVLSRAQADDSPARRASIPDDVFRQAAVHPMLRRVVREALLEGQRVYRRRPYGDGTHVYYHAPGPFCILGGPADAVSAPESAAAAAASELRVWLYTWGAPPTAQCARCDAAAASELEGRANLTPCAACASFHFTYYCGDDCRQKHARKHAPACSRLYVLPPSAVALP